MPLTALLPCINLKKESNFSEEVYIAIFCSGAAQSTATGHTVTLNLRVRTLTLAAIPYRRLKPQNLRRARDQQGQWRMRCTTLFTSQETLKTSFRMQVSAPNTFPLVLFKVLTPAQHQSKMKWKYTHITLPSKKPTCSGNLAQLCHKDKLLSTENRKWRNSSALPVTKDTDEVLSFWEAIFIFNIVQLFVVKQWLGKFVCQGHTLRAHFRKQLQSKVNVH